MEHQIPSTRILQNPIRKPDVLVQDIGGETILYSLKEKGLHILNSTARRIWDMCDGEHSVEDMARVIRTSFSVAGEYDVTADIWRTLEVFTSKGLLRKRP